MKDALNGDALVVCVAGNGPTFDPIYPAYWGSSVGATKNNGQWASYSNYNPDVVAPGVAVLVDQKIL